MWWLTASALAGVPDGVHPVLAPPDVPGRYAAQKAAEGQPVELACDPLWPEHALLCFKRREGDRDRWVTTADATRWGTDVAGLRAWAAERALQVLATQPDRMQVTDSTQSYWVAAEGDGWSAAVLLQPVALAEKIGSPAIHVAAPMDGVVLAWPGGDAALDTIVAVGVREMYDQGKQPISPVIFEWTGTRWREFAEAKPRPEPAP
jgi:hypothetical protein